MMGARYYDPNLGRFLQQDPLGGGGSSQYAYAASDPCNNSDPTGLEVCYHDHPPISSTAAAWGLGVIGGVGMVGGMLIDALDSGGQENKWFMVTSGSTVVLGAVAIPGGPLASYEASGWSEPYIVPDVVVTVYQGFFNLTVNLGGPPAGLVLGVIIHRTQCTREMAEEGANHGTARCIMRGWLPCGIVIRTGCLC